MRIYQDIALKTFFLKIFRHFLSSILLILIRVKFFTAIGPHPKITQISSKENFRQTIGVI